jgi:uncharacterized membrane protein YraQ (UPF0718 family)
VFDALFHGYVPQGWVTQYLGGGAWYAVPAAVVLGIPLYSNATGGIPMAEAMLGKGVAMGATRADSVRRRAGGGHHPGGLKFQFRYLRS